MLVIKLLNLSSKFLLLLSFFMFFNSQALGVDSADIWKKETIKEKESTKKQEKLKEKPKIDFSKDQSLLQNYQPEL